MILCKTGGSFSGVDLIRTLLDHCYLRVGDTLQVAIGRIRNVQFT